MKWCLILLAVLLALFFIYRWAGTSEYEGVVQRVYENQSEYRVELALTKGRVLVAGNSDMKFPYVKLDSADMHAELHRLATTGDTVRLTIWGFRQSWLSMFPNVVDIEVLSTKKERIKARAEQLAAELEAMMERKGVLPKQPGFHDELVRTLEAGLNQPAPHPRHP